MGLNPLKDKILNLLHMASIVGKSGLQGWAGLGSVQLLLVPHSVPGFMLGAGEIRIYSVDIY